MINNFNKDFFNKNNRIKLCTIALTGLMVASPFIVRGMVDTAIDNLDHHNEITVENPIEQEEKSRIDIDFEGEYNEENGVIIVCENKEREDGEPIEAIGIITPNGGDPHVYLPAGSYTFYDYNDSYDIEIDGETEYTLTVNYNDGSITNNDEKTNQPTHQR